MNDYTDYQNYVLNRIAYANLKIDSKPGMTLLECIPEEYSYICDEIKKAGLEHLVLKDYVNNNDTGSRSGFCAIAVEDPTTGAVGVSYRGTEDLDKLTSANQIDMVDNIQTAILGTSDQKREAINFFEKNMNADGSNYLFGHSKGGELASEVYAKYYQKVKGMHLYNPQPINSLKLNKKQRDAFKSDKVDVVIIDGDTVSSLGDKTIYGNRIRYMKCNGTQNGFFGPHLLGSASFNDDQSVEIEPNPYLQYSDQKTFCEIAEKVVGASQWGFLPKTTILVLLVAKIYEFVVQDIPNMIEVFEKAMGKFLDLIDEAKEIIKEIKSQLKQFINSVKNSFTNWYNKHFNAGYKYATNNPYVELNTAKLRDYANRLWAVNRRISVLDRKMDSLYAKVGFCDLWNLLQADALTGYSLKLNRCANYLVDTASDFENLESYLSKQA